MCPKNAVRKSILREIGKLGSIHTVKFSRCTMRHVQNSGEKRVHRRESCKNVNRRKDARRNPQTRAMCPQRIMGLVERCLCPHKGGKRCVLLSCRSLRNASTLFAKARRPRNRDRFPSVDAHAEHKGFKLRRTANSPKILEHHSGLFGQSANK